MRNWSIPAGRVFGVELRIHLTFFFLLIFVWLTESAHGPANAGRGLALVGIIFGSVVLHELGHALVGMRAGIPAKAIILLPIGGVTLIDETQHPIEPGALTWKRDIRIALAGPLVNLLVAVVAGSSCWLSRPQSISGRSLTFIPGICRQPGLVQYLWLALFNLLPAYPMDGGRVLRALFSRSMDPVRATRRAVSIGRAFATVFMLVGMLSARISGSP